MIKVEETDADKEEDIEQFGESGEEKEGQSGGWA